MNENEINNERKQEKDSEKNKGNILNIMKEWMRINLKEKKEKWMNECKRMNEKTEKWKLKEKNWFI